MPWNVIVFTLAIESEAQQIAAAAMQDIARRSRSAARRAIIVTAATPLGRRGAAAFLERWRSLGGEAQAPLELEDSALYKFRTAVKQEKGDLYFLSMGSDLARPVRTIIGRSLPVYGTSLLSVGGVESGARAPELDGVRLLEMPGVIQPNYAASLGYPQAPAEFSLEMQRLYALGIDAFRMARAMFSGRPSFDIDGLTGRLRYDGTQPLIERLPSMAEYRDGLPRRRRRRDRASDRSAAPRLEQSARGACWKRPALSASPPTCATRSANSTWSCATGRAGLRRSQDAPSRGFGGAAASVDHRKQLRLHRAANRFLLEQLRPARWPAVSLRCRCVRSRQAELDQGGLRRAQ